MSHSHHHDHAHHHRDEAHLDSPDRIDELRRTLAEKPALRAWYAEVYRRYGEVLRRCPRDGVALELGSGGGFVKDVLPEVITSDVIAYAGLDRVVDGTAMPFADGELRALFLLNVFHHIPDAAAFLREVSRCLRPGGRMLIVDQHPGLVAKPIFRWAHHEGFAPDAPEWRFASTGPLSSANGALAWMVFQRDHDKLAREFPTLRVLRYAPHSPLRYWLAGGLKAWSLLPAPLFPLATKLDETLARLHPNLGSFVDIEVERVAG